MKEKRFQTTEEIHLTTERELLKISPANFQHCDLQFVERWQKFVSTNGKYFEGDH